MTTTFQSRPLEDDLSGVTRVASQDSRNDVLLRDRKQEVAGNETLLDQRGPYSRYETSGTSRLVVSSRVFWNNTLSK